MPFCFAFAWLNALHAVRHSHTSVYHPCTKTCDDATYFRFLDTLETLLGKVPKKSEIIMGADINSNIGTFDDLHSTEFRAALGPHGLSKRNNKGENLLHVYLAHRLHIMNTIFEAGSTSPGHSIWTSNRNQLRNRGYPHARRDCLLGNTAQVHSQLLHDS